MLNTLQRGLLALSIAAMLGWGLVLYGKSIVQKEWDIETAKREETAKIAAETNKGAIENERKQREATIAAAKSKAGRDAVADYIRKLGMLPTCGAVQSAQPSAENKSPGGIDAVAAELGTGGGATGIESFGMRCALDADHVLRFQQFVRDNPQAFEVLGE